jgi:hypothetical protein
MPAAVPGQRLQPGLSGRRAGVMHVCERVLCACFAFMLCACHSAVDAWPMCSLGQLQRRSRMLCCKEGSHLRANKGPWICATLTLEPQSSRSSCWAGQLCSRMGRLQGLLWQSGGACVPSASMKRMSLLPSVTASPSAPRLVGAQSESLLSIAAICSSKASALRNNVCKTYMAASSCCRWQLPGLGSWTCWPPDYLSSFCHLWPLQQTTFRPIACIRT